MLKHKTLGQVFTPNWIVNEILDLVNYCTNNILTSYIMEPACGDGAFIMEIVKRYISTAKHHNLSVGEIKDGLEKYIYGIEIDSLVYAECINNLNTLVESLIGVKNLKWNIFNENTLNIYKNHQKQFDFIVGNPPYIRIHNVDVLTRNFIKDNFKYSEGTIDIYVTFFEMSFYMLKSNGLIGYITPNSYLHNSSYSKFRDYLKDSRAINTLIDFKANKIFKGFSTYTAITIIDFSNDRKFFCYKEFNGKKIEAINNIAYADLNFKDWSFTDKKNESFLKDLDNDKNTFINELYDVQYGFATLRDNIFINNIKYIDTNNKLVYFNNHLIELDILKTIVKGSKYKGIIDETLKIIYPYKKVNNKYIVIPETELQKNYPYCYDYFLKNKEELVLRDLDKGALWYEYGRSQGVQTMHNEKIILSTLINNKINFYKVDSDVLMYSGIFITKKDQTVSWNIIENMLASDEFYQFIRITGKDFSGGYKSITSKQIKNFKVNYSFKTKLF